MQPVKNWAHLVWSQKEKENWFSIQWNERLFSSRILSIDFVEPALR